MSITLFSCDGGDLLLPHRELVLVSRLDGGNLVVNPPRDVWERSELSPGELSAWSALVAASGRAMLDVLPQLDGGCINYWEAGNWALNDAADPKGPKVANVHRRAHLHLLGRSRSAAHPSWRWGEAPKFPDFVDRFAWAAAFERLTPGECGAIVTRIEELLKGVYGFDQQRIRPWFTCATCGYPMAHPP
jgi:hypothetical protein